MIDLTLYELQSLTPVLERLSARTTRSVNLEQLITNWQSFVQEVENGYGLTGFDYVNDLGTRDFLDELISVAIPSARQKIVGAGVEEADIRFRTATREVAVPLRIATPERPRWWWFRVPIDMTGELSRDLTATEV